MRPDIYAISLFLNIFFKEAFLRCPAEYWEKPGAYVSRDSHGTGVWLQVFLIPPSPPTHPRVSTPPSFSYGISDTVVG